MLHTLSSATPTVALWQRSSIVRQKREQNPQFQAQCTRQAPQEHPTKQHRRELTLSVLALLCQVSASQPAVGKPAIANKEVDDDSSALIQGLLAKSRENKDKYTKERLQDYYRRNYKDYFTYEKGLGQSKSGRGLSDENQQKILKWLKDNP